MKKASTDQHPESLDDELRPEYRFDYSKSRRNRFATEPVMVQLDADVAAVFPTSEAANAALRGLLDARRATALERQAGGGPTVRYGERRRANDGCAAADLGAPDTRRTEQK